ncbi:AhpC/TSA family protein [Pedobacter hiemivivus]|uniref:AhpC/TSA family protein n=1 Tax=Pedobacter hiemivivus TaxID=2530454 RepID=A0A4U1GIW1_9SPHI|nr:TlpA disulfide reductase family protein [Pedobacter hiemivivus]TKC64068.1 AhpC/TSA family protein [Pedobacter hiemivivus]
MKKMNLLSNILLISMSALSITAYAQNTELTGQIKGLSGATVKINYNNNGVFKVDSVTAVNDIFTWKANLNGPQLISLVIDNHSNSYFVGPGHTKLTGVKDASQSYKLTGSPMQDDAKVFSEFIKDLTDQEAMLSTAYGKASTQEKEALNKKREELKIQKKVRANKFIAAHPKSFFSIYLIAGRTGYGYAEVKPLYDMLAESAKQTEAGKKLSQTLETLKKSLIGNQMADFVQADTSGKQVKLSSFRGKYVLVDFWASWCGPCRAENPNVLKAYNAYKDKGFTVVGISLDDKAANWKKAIRDDKMPWTQLSDLKGWKNEISTSYGIQAIPSNLLIDPSGKIIAKDLRGEMLENKLRELFITNKKSK